MSPIGRIVLSAHNITYSDGLNGTSITHLSPQQLITSLGHVTDEFDQTSVEKCFLLSSRDQSKRAMDQTGSTATQSVQIYFKIPKFVSHVQILAPNYPNGMFVCWLYFCGLGALEAKNCDALCLLCHILIKKYPIS